MRYASDDAPSFNKRESNSDGWQSGSTNVPPELRALQPLQQAMAGGWNGRKRAEVVTKAIFPTIGVDDPTTTQGTRR